MDTKCLACSAQMYNRAGLPIGDKRITRARLSVSEDDFCSGGFIYPYGCAETKIEGDFLDVAPDGSSITMSKLEFDLEPCTGTFYSSKEDPDWDGEPFDYTQPYDGGEAFGCPLPDGVTNKLAGQHVVVENIQLTCSKPTEADLGAAADF